jgi:hypothetical protein
MGKIRQEMTDINKSKLSARTRNLRDWAMTAGQHYGYLGSLRR